MEQLLWTIRTLQPTDVLDILIVALLFFAASFLIRGTQAVTLLRGMVMLIIGLIVIAGLLQLRALTWLLTNGLTVLAVAIPVIFQPELRRALEQIGRGGMLFRKQTPTDIREAIINEVVKASEKLSERRHGALIVLQKNSSLENFKNGIPIDSAVRAELLLTIFWPKTELHDGAVIIDDEGRVASAAAVLPLTASRNLPNPKMGTRHRAALGISEESDAICVVVSEETGRIAVAHAGRMVPRLDSERLRTILTALYGPSPQERVGWWARLRDRLQTTSRVPRKSGSQV